MKWNPTLSKWEGNEEDLRDFDVPSPTRPALISNLGIPTSGTVSVGAMTFDPVKMRWVGNEREMDDAFGEFGDDDAASVMSIPIASRREFDIPPSLRDTLARAEDAHRAFMSRWYLKGATESFKGAQRPIPRNYMYDIYR
ncbi:hypothetical protein M427DRAFT_165914 [Gonapodya prolifera JEL478]|uniref:Uncharacterized protein n=1 Tax=Gonapodya prolifera (strain JEL478) TaxID=1344416 RepID=A0A139B0B7_GONPJ|nr:hypothetical protein M427DRAFT_165914 [Gonapodya prolifera JEL478]|eukprot:KXS22145.1 hypothetical protein M427DRAFT_165914 [Gonapodya prolifera JEL478]